MNRYRVCACVAECQHTVTVYFSDKAVTPEGLGYMLGKRYTVKIIFEIE